VARSVVAADAVLDGLTRMPSEGEARFAAERMALVLQGALLVRHGPAAVADAFCATRLAGEGGRSFGALPRGLDIEAIVARQAVLG